MIHSSKSDWEKVIERRSSNIGYLSKTGAFREPTETEKARALMIETKSWQESIGKKTYTVSAEYSTPKKQQHEPRLELRDRMNKAVKAYIETPMDVEFKKSPKWYRKLFSSEPTLFSEILVNVLPLIMILGIIYMILKLKGD